MSAADESPAPTSARKKAAGKTTAAKRTVAKKAAPKALAKAKTPVARKTAAKEAPARKVAAAASVPLVSLSPQPAPAAESPHPEAPAHTEVHAGHATPDRFRTVLAILIAFVSVMGAITTWRAEVSGSEAGQANSEGQIVEATAAGELQQFLAEAQAQAHAAQVSYEDQRLYTIDERQAATASPAVAAQLRLEAIEDNAVALKLLDLRFWTVDYVAHNATQLPTSVTYDVNRQVSDLMRENEVDTNSQRWYDDANADLNTRNQLYGLDLLLVMSLALMAIAQIVRRRRSAWLWAAPGGALLVAALALFIVVEA
jgi:hypothetical protein